MSQMTDVSHSRSRVAYSNIATCYRLWSGMVRERAGELMQDPSPHAKVSVDFPKNSSISCQLLVVKQAAFNGAMRSCQYFSNALNGLSSGVSLGPLPCNLTAHTQDSLRLTQSAGFDFPVIESPWPDIRFILVASDHSLSTARITAVEEVGYHPFQQRSILRMLCVLDHF